MITVSKSLVLFFCRGKKCVFIRAFATTLLLLSLVIFIRLWKSPSTVISNVKYIPGGMGAKTIDSKSFLPAPGFQQHTGSEILPVKQDQANAQQTKTTLTTTTTCYVHHFLLILVSSAPGNLDRRRFIRQTWGTDSAITARWKTVFLLGQSRNKEQSKLLVKEGNFYGDLIRANYYEDYYNQTLKIQMGFEWATKYCNFTFLLKADDDVFVNPWAMISVLNESNVPKEKLYMGFAFKKAPVFRTGKWGVSRKEYGRKFYPQFCPGFSFILSTDTVHKFVSLFDAVPFFKLDDVYVGMLAKKAGVKALYNRGFQMYSKNCTIQLHTLVRHGETKACRAKLFRIAMDANMNHS